MDVKQFHYKKFLGPLIQDIKCLEQEAIFVEVVRQFVKATVFCVCADNLAAHSLAGFHESLIVEKFCRFCLISQDQIATTEVNYFQLRDVDQYNISLEELGYNDNLQSINGLKKGMFMEQSTVLSFNNWISSRCFA